MSKDEDEEFGSSPDAYRPPSYRGALIMLVVAAIGILIVWAAYVNWMGSAG